MLRSVAWHGLHIAHGSLRAGPWPSSLVPRRQCFHLLVHNLACLRTGMMPWVVCFWNELCVVFYTKGCLPPKSADVEEASWWTTRRTAITTTSKAWEFLSNEATHCLTMSTWALECCMRHSPGQLLNCRYRACQATHRIPLSTGNNPFSMQPAPTHLRSPPPEPPPPPFRSYHVL
jgi:hypothetical protein